MLSGFFKSERSKYTGVIWHVKIKSLGRGHTHKNASDEVGRQMMRARGPRNTIVDFPPLPHLRLCIAACRSKDFLSQGRGQDWDRVPCLAPGTASASSVLPPLLVPSLGTQPFITGVLYSQHSCFLFLSHPTKAWSGKLDSGVLWGGVHGFRAPFTTACS